MKKTLLAVLVATLAGCASQDYKLYAESQTAIQTAKSNAEAAKYKAMADIAQSGDTTAKVAAMMALQSNNQAGQSPYIAAPKSTSETIRDWVGMILPVAVQGYGIFANSQVSINSSNNSARVSESTNAAFVGMASKIQAPVANVDNHSQVLSGYGTMGAGSYSTTQTPAPIQITPVNNLITPTIIPPIVIDGNITNP